VPAQLWKVIIVLPTGQNDLSRINAQTRIIAVNIPNKDSVGQDSWGQYCISTSDLEAKTGLTFFSNLPNDIKKSIKDKVDSGPNK
jgi:endonuclease G